jgi:hypothetical protein
MLQNRRSAYTKHLMDVLQLRVVRPARSAYEVARLLVNGRDLVDLLAAFERAFAGDLAGAYEPLPADDLIAPSRHLLGEPHRLYQYADGRVALLGCECGESGCWPFVARIEITDDRVIWRDFAQPHRPQWSYADFGPFVFERTAYEAALRPPSSASQPVRQN